MWLSDYLIIINKILLTFRNIVIHIWRSESVLTCRRCNCILELEFVSFYFDFCPLLFVNIQYKSIQWHVTWVSTLKYCFQPPFQNCADTHLTLIDFIFKQNSKTVEDWYWGTDNSNFHVWTPVLHVDIQIWGFPFIVHVIISIIKSNNITLNFLPPPKLRTQY